MIPNDDEVMAPKGPGRRFRARPVPVHEDPPVIPVEDELPMDPYNIAIRELQDDLASGVNHIHSTLEYIMSHMHIPHNDSLPSYLYIQSWEDRWRARQGGPGGSGTGGGDKDDE